MLVADIKFSFGVCSAKLESRTHVFNSAFDRLPIAQMFWDKLHSAKHANNFIGQIAFFRIVGIEKFYVLLGEINCVVVQGTLLLQLELLTTYHTGTVALNFYLNAS